MKEYEKDNYLVFTCVFFLFMSSVSKSFVSVSPSKGLRVNLFEYPRDTCGKDEFFGNI